MNYVKINVPRSDLINIPLIGFGTWQIPQGEAEKLVATALKVGYNHIDCANFYNNEHEIGKCFAKLKNRSEIYIVSKLWSTDHEPSKVAAAFDLTLKNLRIDYLDIYLIHNPCRINDLNQPLWYSKELIVETWREMVKLHDTGKVKHIGVSNFTTKKLKWLLEEHDKPSNNQVELHPYLPQNKLLRFCKDHEIVVTGYSPLGSPGTAISNPAFVTAQAPVLLNDQTIKQIAKKHGATPAQVLIKWGVNRGTPVLVKSSNEHRMKENLASLNLNLSDEDMELIRNIAIKCRYVNFEFICSEGHTFEEFWDGEYIN